MSIRIGRDFKKGNILRCTSTVDTTMFKVGDTFKVIRSGRLCIIANDGRKVANLSSTFEVVNKIYLGGE